MTTRFFLLAALAAATPAFAQQATTTIATTQRADTTVAAVADTQPTKKAAARGPRYIAPVQQIQYMRYVDQRGLNVFESPKEAGADYTGFKLAWGGAFTQ